MSVGSDVAVVAARAIIGLAFALVTGVTAAPPPLAVTLLIAVRVASRTSLNLSIN